MPKTAVKIAGEIPDCGCVGQGFQGARGAGRGGITGRERGKKNPKGPDGLQGLNYSAKRDKEMWQKLQNPKWQKEVWGMERRLKNVIAVARRIGNMRREEMSRKNYVTEDQQRAKKP